MSRERATVMRYSLIHERVRAPRGPPLVAVPIAGMRDAPGLATRTPARAMQWPRPSIAERKAPPERGFKVPYDQRSGATAAIK
jgi:hypothetical protein